ncbi:MAG TPA: ORF6N domain-containing protein [Candidatus Ozemobacteraceae bacterium]|nr:ORF6N domain-containing protein [Candidatus Ozemobacteraceae bacterium]
MANKTEMVIREIPATLIESRIYTIRGQRVMIDADLAGLYGVETRVLNQAVKRNSERFPLSFMFQLTYEEAQNLKSQTVISSLETGTASTSHGGRRKLPLAFTEHGALMLATVLKSNTAGRMSIRIIEAFVKMRQLISSNADLEKKIRELERKYDGQFRVVFQALHSIINPVSRKKKPYRFHPERLIKCRKKRRPQPSPASCNQRKRRASTH